MAVLDWYRQLLGGGDPADSGLAYASSQASPDLLQYAQDVLSGKVAAGGALAQNYYDPNRSFAQNALDPRAIEQATDVVFGIGPGAIRAWHASPYDFNKFDINKVGSGQGAQSYGHGIYAAESPAVSGKGGQYDLEFTAKNLGKYDLNPGELQIHRMLREDRSDMDILGELARGGGYTFDEALAALERVKGAKAKIYEVDIHADPKAFLDLDKSLGSQSPSVLQALQEIGTPQSMMSVNATDAIRRAGENPIRAADLFNRGGAPLEMTPADVSARLREAGISGSRYLDAGSRQYELVNPSYTGEQWRVVNHANQIVAKTKTEQEALDWMNKNTTSNYAIFDPSIIEILRKYGILPPAVATGGLLATQGEPPT